MDSSAARTLALPSHPSQCQFCVGCPTDNSARLFHKPSFAMLLRILLLVCTGGGQCTCLVQSLFGIAQPCQGPDRFRCPLALRAIAQWHAQNIMCELALQNNQSGGFVFRNLAYRTNLVEYLVSNLSNDETLTNTNCSQIFLTNRFIFAKNLQHFQKIV